MAIRSYTLTLGQPLARGLHDVITTRFDHVSTDGAVVIVQAVDQACLRALLTLLWDAGHEVLTMTSSPYPG